jgi:RNA polymerase sigma factor (sigma-70 family)
LNDDVLEAVKSGNVNTFVGLIHEQARKLTVTGVSHPERRSWNPDDVDELVNDFFSTAKWRSAIENAIDDDGLRAYVYTMLRNSLIDQFRRTDRGRLLIRLKKILREGEFIEFPKGYWRRPSDPENAFAGREADLVEASWSVDVDIVTWSPNAKRQAPETDTKSFLRLLNSIMNRADGAVQETQLVMVLADRLGLQSVSFTEVLDIADPSLGPEERLVVIESDDDATDLVVDIWSQLSPEERRMVPLVELSSRDAAARLGIGRTKASQIQARLKEKLRVILLNASEDLSRTVLAKLLDLSRGADA